MKTTFTAAVRGRQLVFTCPYCECEHFHGVEGGAGHRAAHCHKPDSPYQERGYWLDVVEWWPRQFR